MIIRWICEKDNKKWMYPITKCIYCKGPIRKQISKEAKIIGITKVNIPSPSHPIIPYNIILLEDEHGNRMPKKTMKNYSIGETYSVEKAKKDSAVIISKIKYDVGEALKESLELLKSFDINVNDSVLIKPSIIEPAYPHQAVNTNPKLIEEIIKLLKEKGVSDIAVGEQASLGNDTIESASKSGILDVCKKYDVKVIDLGKTEFVKISDEEMEFNIAKGIIERKVINVPVMKTNSQIGVSGAMENMIRVTDEKTQKEMFSEDIEKILPRLIKALPKFLTIGDATVGMQGQGPTSLGEPAFINMLLVSKDPVAVDAVFSEIGMLSQPAYVKEASRINAGEGNIMGMEIVGYELEAAKYHLKAPDKGVTAHPRISLIDGKSNPYTFNTALGITAKLFGLPGYEMNLAIGKFISHDMVAGKNRIIAYGEDAISKLRELNVDVSAEIPENSDDISKLAMIKSILENPEKKKLGASDKIKSKLASLGAKIKGAF